MRRVGVSPVVLLPLVVVAGCGGGHQAAESTGLYTLAATRSCLVSAGFQASAAENHYLPGSGGNLRVRLTNHGPALLAPNASRTAPPSDEYVFLVFDHGAAAARTTEERALTLAMQSVQADGLVMTRNQVRDGVGLNKNVFFYSAAGTLTKDERRKVVSCLR